MPSRLNEALMKEFQGRVGGVSHGILVNYTGLSVNETNALRKRLMKNALRMTVLKNRIANLVLKPKFGDGIGQVLKGPTAVIYGGEDPVSAAKTVLECCKGLNKLQVRGGFIEGKSLTKAEVEALSKMPSKEDLLSQVLTGIITPASNLAYCFDAIYQQLNFGAVATELGGLLDSYHEKLKSSSS